MINDRSAKDQAQLDLGVDEEGKFKIPCFLYYILINCVLYIGLLETEIPLPGCLEEAAGLVKSKEEHVGGTFVIHEL